MRLLALIPIMLASPAWAEIFDRPIPQAQSATAEFWFGVASITLVLALYVVHRLVKRK